MVASLEDDVTDSLPDRNFSKEFYAKYEPKDVLGRYAYTVCILPVVVLTIILGVQDVKDAVVFTDYIKYCSVSRNTYGIIVILRLVFIHVFALWHPWCYPAQCCLFNGDYDIVVLMLQHHIHKYCSSDQCIGLL